MILIGFSTQPKNWISRIIRWATNSRVSHAWILDTEGFYGEPVVFEATEVGFRIVPYEVFERENELIALVAPKVPIEGGLKQAAKWLGERYDFAGLFMTGFVLIARSLHMKLRNPLVTPRAMFCSEAVVRILQAAQYPGADELDPESMTPQDLLVFFGKS